MSVINAQDKFRIHDEKSIVEDMGDMKDALDRIDPDRTATAILEECFGLVKPDQMLEKYVQNLFDAEKDNGT